MLMKECIKLAEQGSGHVSPNPLVGAILLDKDNNIISKSYHKQYGENHAERNALIDISNDISTNGTLIVNLEPCVHYGKTPPCVDLIIEKKIKKVVIGMRDVNPIVSGNGINKLREAGIEVIEGILENECLKLNEIFIKNMKEHKTFVAIKTATTIDGKIATHTGDSKWITSDAARNFSKTLRDKYDAILTTSATILADNPRMVHRNKIILDSDLKIDYVNSEIFKTGLCYIFYNKNINPQKLEFVKTSIRTNSNIIFIPTNIKDKIINLEDLLKKIYELGIMSVFVEAGGRFNGSILKYADKIYHFIAPKIIGDNNALSCFNYRVVDTIKDVENLNIQETEIIGSDILITYTR